MPSSLNILSVPPDASALEVERRRQGLSRRQLAHKAGVGHVTVFNIETGRVKPTFAIRAVLAMAFGVETTAVFPLPGDADRS